MADARKMESEITVFCFVKIFPENSQSLSETALTTIQEMTDKDLQKSVEDGSVVYRVGPFNDRQEAERISEAVRQAGETNVSVTEAE